MSPAAGAPSAEEQLAAAEATFGELCAELTKANLLFANSRREGALHALRSVLEFLEASPAVASHGLHAPLLVLYDALQNLDDGVVQPILQKTWRRDRGRTGALRQTIKGAVAFTVDRLCAVGMQLPDAHQLVAHLLKKEGVLTERGRDRAVTDRTIRGWCEEVTADVGRKGEAAQIFDLMQRDIARASGSDAKAIQRELLDRLGNLIVRTRSEQKPVKPPS